MREGHDQEGEWGEESVNVFRTSYLRRIDLMTD